MKYERLRQELKSYYWQKSASRAAAFGVRCFSVLNSKVTADMSVMEQKLLQYKVITDELEPVLFADSPFYYETGTLSGLSDGGHRAKENEAL